ncbi:dihydrodipicolinate synthase family protein [Pseudogracilibacillus auburnensis]|uniref:dihydrodipicolinate synthase family protein n=1 Tax=Pseudogracilibacillus auburnensis TaxID=1494959 RepID=UPI001A97802E|nr:dihydrodipicolinate synthase family protein [Pseudogracilibacillus auburnensis]MBO1004823.1 dihydrodipicolinate synthase family protein [Pseudogracilibacillus auburnensis]
MTTYDLDKFKGVFVAMYSAYDEEGNVCTDRVKNLAKYYVNTGVEGLYVGGSSGEGVLQTVEERKKMLEAVMEAVGDQLKIIVHVGANSTKESIELAVHAEKCGADAISSIPAVYYRLSEDAVENHWQQMIDSTSLPFIIYNIPQTTGFNLTQTLFKKMAAQDKVIGVKMSGESVYELQQFKANAGKEFLVFNGPDEQYLGGRIMGADGGIGGTYGVMPELFCQLDEYFKQGEIEKAQELQAAINEIITRLLSFPSLYGATKAILQLRGVETGIPRSPMLPIKDTDWAEVEKLNGVIERLVAEHTNTAKK